MKATISSYGALALIAIASMHNIATARAGSCAGEIADFENALPRDNNGEPTFVGAMPQSIGAQLEHQPTLSSVKHAREQSQLRIFAVLAQAEAFDSEGKQSECREAITRARLLLNL
jgi:hypothetical protein